MAETITINDVGPRDGLQNQAKILSVEDRLRMIDALIDANVKYIEVGAFVSAKAVPAMAGAEQIVRDLDTRQGEFSVLIPNERGYDFALEAGAKTVAMVIYGSEGMAVKNVKMSQAQAAKQAETIIKRAQRDNVEVIATITTSFVCPFDGPTKPETVKQIAAKFLDLGVAQLVVADTIGAANPAQVSSMMQDLVVDHGSKRLACHFHDTRAMGLANVYAAVEAGIRRFDASIGGLGGCPFAPGATGNVATEDVVMMLESMGYDTGIKLDRLMVASDLAEELTGTAPGGRSKMWLKPYLQKQH